MLIGWGLFKKIAIADRLADSVNQVYDNVHLYQGWSLIIATFIFGIQLYCDFSGYSDMSTGCAKILGYDLTRNFKLPYFSHSIQEFWRRWHVSLSTWFRDYLYIPLGGNRVSKSRNYFNILIVFLASGLWHGTGWTYAIWGMLHGIYLIMGRLTQRTQERIIRFFKLQADSRMLKVLRIFSTYCLVNFAWLFFRANSWSDCLYILSNFFNIFHGIGLSMSEISISKQIVLGLLVFLLVEVFEYYKGISFFLWIRKTHPFIRWPVYYLFAMLLILIGDYGSGTFIYFQY